jgi:predicted aspartyl protease
MVRAVVSLAVLAILAPVSTAGAPPSTALSGAQIDKVLREAHHAAGGAQLDAFGAVTLSGSVVQNGGPPSGFDSVTNLRNGYSRTRLVVGPATLLQGYDGSEWSELNGALSIVSLPSFVADAVTQAYLSSNAYFRRDQRSTVVSGHVDVVNGRKAYALHVEPAGGSSADLYFDAATHLLVRTVAQTAQGADTTTNSRFQTIQGVPTAMQTVDVDPAGTRTVATLTTAQYAATLDPSALARPAYVSQGQLAGPVSIPIVSTFVGDFGHVVLPVALDGQQASLIFDSGGSNFLLPTAAQRLGLKTSGGLATGGAGTKEQMTSFAAVSTVDAGGARLSHQTFVVTPLAYAFSHPRKGVSSEGLIGYEYLANFRVSVRYADDRVDFAPFDAPAPTGGVTLPFKSDGRHAYVLATIDGVQGYFILDTGNGGGIVLNEPFVREHHLFPDGGLTYQSPGGVGGGFAQMRAVAASFTLGGQTFHDVPVDVPQVKAGFFATHGVAGNIGSGFMMRYTVVFDYKAQTVTFIPNQNVDAPFRADGTGMSLNQRGPDAIDVVAVIPDTPAATAGIAARDRITAVGGTPVSSGLGVGDLRPYLTGTAPFTLTIDRAGTSKTVTLTPRTILPAAQ